MTGHPTFYIRVVDGLGHVCPFRHPHLFLEFLSAVPSTFPQIQHFHKYNDAQVIAAEAIAGDCHHFRKYTP